MNFDLHSETYDAYAFVQKNVADVLVEKIRTRVDLTKYQTCLDIGCGTGYLSLKLEELNDNLIFSLNDLSLNMINLADVKLKSESRHVCGNFLEIDFNATRYDLVVSSFAIQWMHDIEAVLHKIKKLGKTAFLAFPIEGTFSNIKNFQTLSFYRFRDIEKILNKIDVDYKLDVLDFYQEFINYFSFVRALYKIGAIFKTPKDFKKNNIFSSEKIIADYKVLFITILN